VGQRNNSDGSLNNQGSNGNYWSATQNNATNGYNLNFNSGNSNPSNNNDKAYGFSVRCVQEITYSFTPLFYSSLTYWFTRKNFYLCGVKKV